MSKYHQLLQWIIYQVLHKLLRKTSNFVELPDCLYPMSPTTMITPCCPTPKRSLFLSNLDDQIHLRMSIDYVYLFNKSVSLDVLKSSLSKVLVDYYPLAGRLRTSIEDDTKLEVDCNGEGALFVEASMDITVEELLKYSMMPNMSWNKFKCQVESQSFLGVPPLLIQVTNLRCGGMILCATISHCLCDGIGASQFLTAWTELTKNIDTKLTIMPFHERHMLKSRDPTQVKFPHPIYKRNLPNLFANFQIWILSQPLVPTSFIFGPTDIHQLKKQCTASSLECITDFEVVASHTWRSWVRSLNLSPTRIVKLVFTINFRRKIKLPKGYYGNGFVFTCVETKVNDLVAPNNLCYCVKLVQQAKGSVDNEYVRSTIDLMKDKTIMPHDSVSLFISPWNRLGLEDMDFGEGKSLYMGPSRSQFYCLFLPVIGNTNAVRVFFSVPKSVVESFQHNMGMIDSYDKDEKDGIIVE